MEKTISPSSGGLCSRGEDPPGTLKGKVGLWQQSPAADLHPPALSCRESQLSSGCSTLHSSRADTQRRCVAAIKSPLKRNNSKFWTSQLRGTGKPWKPLRAASSVDELSGAHRAICGASPYYTNYKLIYCSLHSKAVQPTNAPLQRSYFKTSFSTFMI